MPDRGQGADDAKAMKKPEIENRKAELLQEANALILEGSHRWDPENREARLRAAEIRAELRALTQPDPIEPVDPEQYLTIEELCARLKLDPQAVKDLIAQMAAAMTKEYLTIEELAQRLSWDERTVKNKMAAGIFRRGVHYFSPKGIRPRFKWSVIRAWLEEREQPAGERPASAIPMARGYYLGQARRKKTVNS